MSYSTGEALILTRVQACTGFSSTNTARSNWKILNQGKSDHYAILKPGKPRHEWITITDYIIYWTTIIEVWQRYTDETTTQNNLYTHINNLLPILAYPNMGSVATVLDSTIGDWEEPEEMWTESGGPLWLRWKVPVIWQEQVSVTFSE